jgi:SAM-dependent methyltransferase
LQDSQKSFLSEKEIHHGMVLSRRDPERIWGWQSPAGRQRAVRRASMIARGAGLTPGAHALEIGCGTGLFTELLSRTGARIMAVDISPDLIERARMRGLPADRILFIEGRFENSTIKGPFDAIVGSSVLHHLQMDEALPIMYDLLRPGGVLCFTEPNMLNPQIFLQKKIPWIKRWAGDSPHETAFTRWGIRRALRRTGFRIDGITPFDWLHPAVPPRLIKTISRWGQYFEKIPLLREFAGSLYILASRPPIPEN